MTEDTGLANVIKTIEDFGAKSSEAQAKVKAFYATLLTGSASAAKQQAKDFAITGREFDTHIDGLKSKAAALFPSLESIVTAGSERVGAKLASIFDNFNTTGVKAGFASALKGLESFATQVQIELDPGSTSSLKSNLGGMLKEGESFVKDNALDIGKFMVFKEMPKLAYEKLIPKQFQNAEKEISDWGVALGSSLSGLSDSFAASESASVSFGEGMQGAMLTAKGAVEKLGIAPSVARAELKKLLDTGFGEVNELKIDTGDSREQIKGLAAAYVLAKSTGQSTDEVNKQIIESTRALGRKAEDVDDIFAAVRVTQQGTNLSYKTVQDTLMQGTRSLAYYGTSLESVTGLFRSLTKSLGENKAALAAPMFADMIKGMEGMSDATRGFIALSTGMAGPGGAISGILAMEDALKEGNIDEIIDKVQGTVEKLSGGDILTREQAKEQGASGEQRYFLQRKLMSQMTQVTDTGKLREMQDMLGKGDRVRAGDIMTGPELGAAKDDLATRGQAVTAAEEGPIRAQFNRMMGESISGLIGFTDGLSKSTLAMGEYFQGTMEDMRTLGSAAAISGGKAMQGLEHRTYGQIMADADQEAPISPASKLESVEGMRAEGMTHGGAVSTSSVGVDHGAAMNSSEMMRRMGMSPPSRYNAEDVMSGMGMYSGSSPQAYNLMGGQAGAGELGGGGFKLDVGSATQVASSIAASGGLSGGAGSAGAAGAAGGIGGTNKLQFKVPEEPIQFKIELKLDNQGRLTGELAEGMRDIALQVGRDETNGDY